MSRVFVGVGFGPIQAGLFVKEAADSGRFSEIVVSEVDAELVDAVRAAGGRYVVNVAGAASVEAVSVSGVTLLNPAVAAERARLLEGLARASEVVTSLPSVACYARGGEASVARLLAEGLAAEGVGQTAVYTAENDNHAAERLEREVCAAGGGRRGRRQVQMLNTVIGKMSQVVTGREEIARRGLQPVTPGFPRAYLVESFNRILVSRITLPGFRPALAAFEEKEALLPFEEAKLYGHNAAHTLLGFLGARLGVATLSELRGRSEVLGLVREAFVGEAGAGLIARHAGLGDPLFTRPGFEAYAEDLLARMTSPLLGDSVARAIRDPARKLGRADRLFGAIRLCLEAGVSPVCLAAGAWAGMQALAQAGGVFGERFAAAARCGGRPEREALMAALEALWGDGVRQPGTAEVAEVLLGAPERLARVCGQVTGRM